jgi:hypothetical protein
MPRRSARRARKRVGRRFVAESSYPVGSPLIPKASDWILLSRQYGDHSFKGTDSRVPEKPGCYEIGVSLPDKPPDQWIVYAGKTGRGNHNLRRRFYNHASGHGSNVKEEVNQYLKRGYWVWARFYATNSVDEAEALEKLLLKTGWWHYLWNTNEVPPNLLV